MVPDAGRGLQPRPQRLLTIKHTEQVAFLPPALIFEMIRFKVIHLHQTRGI
jgi:hypothetical protein